MAPRRYRGIVYDSARWEGFELRPDDIVTGLRAHGLAHADSPVARRLQQGPLRGSTVGDPLRD